MNSYECCGWCCHSDVNWINNGKIRCEKFNVFVDESYRCSFYSEFDNDELKRFEVFTEELRRDKT